MICCRCVSQAATYRDAIMDATGGDDEKGQTGMESERKRERGRERDCFDFP